MQVMRLPIDIWKIVGSQQMLLVTKWPAFVKGNRLGFALVAATLACSVVTEVEWLDRQLAVGSLPYVACMCMFMAAVTLSHGACKAVIGT